MTGKIKIKWLICSVFIFLITTKGFAVKFDLDKLTSPILFQGNETTAFRDPAVLYHDGKFFLFFTLVETEPDGKIYSYTASSISTDLIHWTKPKKLTEKNQNLDFSSPGNVIYFNDEWILCLQTYPRLDYTADQAPRYANATARLYIMRSKNLTDWSKPEMLKVKGPDIPVEKMGRMIDPFLLEDKDVSGKIWCFYKQSGVSMSYSYDLKNWIYAGHTGSGENVSMLVENGEYILFHSPSNGIGIKKSKDLKTWKDWGGLITLGQNNWDWAKGRITAGTVLKFPENPQTKYLMFFHGSGPLIESQGDFDKNASIGIAWSDDLIHWNWPGKHEE